MEAIIVLAILIGLVYGLYKLFENKEEQVIDKSPYKGTFSDEEHARMRGGEVEKIDDEIKPE